jgi:hypothetical protein
MSFPLKPLLPTLLNRIFQMENLVTKPKVSDFADQGKVVGCTLGGFLVGHAIGKAANKDNKLSINAALAAGSFVGATATRKNKIACGLLIGSTIYFGTRTLNNLADDGSTQGVNGFGFALPDSARTFIKDHVPTLSGDDDVINLTGYSGWEAMTTCQN